MNFLDKTGLAHLWGKITDVLNTKVDKVNGKSLSTNDYTNEDKNKVGYLSDVTSNVQSQLNAKATSNYVDTAIANIEEITNEEIDAICGAKIYTTDEVTL